MKENQGLLSSGWGLVAQNKRYLFWFWLMNLTLAEFGVSAFRSQAHAILDHSLLSGSLLHGFDISTFIEMLVRPEFGPMEGSAAPAMFFAFSFFAMTVLFLPGVFQGYASSYRLPRDQFFRACGRNLWRFIRLLVIAGIVMGAVAGALFGLQGLLEKAAGESTNELLLPEVQFAGLAVIFVVMTALRVWFDLAEADVVLDDQNAVRKSIGMGFRNTRRNLGRLVGSYVAVAVLALIGLVAGLWVWMKFVPTASLVGAFVVSQLMLFFLLIPRFWQRGVAVAYWKQRMMAPIVTMQPVTPTPVIAAAPVLTGPAAAPEAPAV